MEPSVLIVDDERNVRLMYRTALENMCRVDDAASAARALEMLTSHCYDVAILDLRLPETTGLELLQQMNHFGIVTPAIFVTAFADVPNAVNAMKCGAIDFLQKPITPNQLRTIVKDVLVRHSKEERKSSAPHDFDYFLRCAKRAINIRDFAATNRNLASALKINPNSPQALNLSGVMFEMREEFDEARRFYGRAIKVKRDFEPAQANMRRIFELFNFGSSQEPFNLENR
jgi:FixJ family two-component response regulator